MRFYFADHHGDFTPPFSRSVVRLAVGENKTELPTHRQPLLGAGFECWRFDRQPRLFVQPAGPLLDEGRNFRRGALPPNRGEAQKRADGARTTDVNTEHGILRAPAWSGADTADPDGVCPSSGHEESTKHGYPTA